MIVLTIRVFFGKLKLSYHTMPPILYPRERQLLDFITQFIQRYGYAPTLKEIAAALNVSSLATVHEHLQALERKNVIKRHEGTVRGIELVDRTFLRVTDSIDLPILGFIAAGSPIEPYTDPNATLNIPGNFASSKIYKKINLINWSEV